MFLYGFTPTRNVFIIRIVGVFRTFLDNFRFLSSVGSDLKWNKKNRNLLTHQNYFQLAANIKINRTNICVLLIVENYALFWLEKLIH